VVRTSVAQHDAGWHREKRRLYRVQIPSVAKVDCDRYVVTELVPAGPESGVLSSAKERPRHDISEPTPRHEIALDRAENKEARKILVSCNVRSFEFYSKSFRRNRPVWAL